MVPIYVVVIFVASALGMEALPFDKAIQAGVAYLTAGLLAGLALYFTAKKIEGKDVRELIDARTGQRVVIRPSAGSFFFIPTRYWAYITAGLGLLTGVPMFFR